LVFPSLSHIHPPFFFVSLPLFISRKIERPPCPVSLGCRAGWRGMASAQPPQPL
jgi:hypothetical protein